MIATHANQDKEIYGIYSTTGRCIDDIKSTAVCMSIVLEETVIEYLMQYNTT